MEQTSKILKNGIMKAWRIHEFGGYEAMRLEVVDIPVPEKGEVLIKVHTAAINHYDWYMSDGLLEAAGLKITLPAIFGRDGAGEVVALGEGVTEFKIGDEVYGQADPESDGTFAEYAILRADRLMRKPETLSFIESAAIPNSIYAAWDALFSETTGIDLKAGDTVLVLGAGGGIGTMTVQLAKWVGAKVIAVASAGQESLLRELGADEFIDYKTQRFEDIVGKRVDVVIDNICKEPEEKSYSVLIDGGMYITMPKPPNFEAAIAAGVKAVFCNGPAAHKETAKIESVVKKGIIRPTVSEVIGMLDVPDGIKRFRSGGTLGKIVVSI